MTPTITLPETKEVYSEYPEIIEQYFENTIVVIKTFPIDFSSVAEIEFPDFRITSAKQYVDFLDQEIIFWNENDPKNELSNFAHKEKLLTARTHFSTAIKYINSNSVNNVKNYLVQSTNAIAGGVLYSKTKLAKTVLEYKENKPWILKGFRMGLQTNQDASGTFSSANVEGLLAAFSYKGILKESIELSQKTVETISDNILSANENYEKLNLQYTQAFYDQESRIKSIHQQTEKHLRDLTDESLKYKNDTKKRFDDLAEEYSTRFDALEVAYKEHLKLEASAKYWEETDKEYTKKGRIWLGISIGFTILIVAALLLTLALIPNIFSEKSHWFDILKNSAIITILTSIAVYLLRVFIKLSMSSFHLSRDAKERNKLSYFYLALIRDGAVTDRERAIILNALFSRSDTGLLKGEASPTMSNNVVDLIETINK